MKSTLLKVIFKVKRVAAAAKKKDGKKITKFLEKKNSKALQYVFKLCKQSMKDKKDIMGMPCILGKDGKLKVTLQEKIKIWKEYEEKLLNEENDWNKSLEITKVKGPCKQVSTGRDGSSCSNECRKGGWTKQSDSGVVECLQKRVCEKMQTKLQSCQTCKHYAGGK